MGKSAAHPVEVKARAFGLYLDYVPARMIAEILDVAESTIQSWIHQGKMVLDGNEIPWRTFRDLCEATRGAASSERGLQRAERFEWEKYVSNFTEDAAKDLQQARKFIIDALAEVDDDGKPRVTPSLAQLPKIIEAEHLVQGKATKIVEMQKSMTILVGQIVAKNVMNVIKDERAAAILLDQIEEDFTRLVSVGGDERAVEKLLKA